jgi:hypothetical protein
MTTGTIPLGHGRSALGWVLVAGERARRPAGFLFGDTREDVETRRAREFRISPRDATSGIAPPWAAAVRSSSAPVGRPTGVSVDPRGTPFQRRVLAALARGPGGVDDDLRGARGENRLRRGPRAPSARRAARTQIAVAIAVSPRAPGRRPLAG